MLGLRIGSDCKAQGTIFTGCVRIACKQDSFNSYGFSENEQYENTQA